MVKPIKPEEIVDAKANTLPKEVIEVFNMLIAKHWDGSASRIYQAEAAEMISERMECDNQYLYDNHHMDIEDIYRAIGWKVYYDRPAYNETYRPTYTFSID